MRYALFLGCQIPSRVTHYETSVRAVMERLDVTLEDIRQFNCCGYPMRNSSLKSFVLSSVRNLALAEAEGLDMLVLCKCCYGSLKKAGHLMKEKGELQEDVLKDLRREGLSYNGKSSVKHLLTVLHRDIGLDDIKASVSRPYADLEIAAHYGCHALRPSSVTCFDDPVSPRIFEDLIEVTGAKSVDWPMRLECCGSPAMGINDELSMSMTLRKLDDVRKSGAHYISTACPYCQLQFDSVQEMMIAGNNEGKSTGSILYSQLLGLSMGIDGEELGINENRIGINDIVSYQDKE